MRPTALLPVAAVAASLLLPSTARADEPAPPVSDAPPAKAEFREPGRFGLMGAVTDDGFQFGVARAGEHYEVIVSADASFVAVKSSTAVTGATGDLGVTVRGGPRFSLGKLNYLSVGGQYHRIFLGKDNGVSTWGSFSTGPYVGLARNFAGTPLMIGLWVMPYQYQHLLSSDGAGGQVVTNNHQFFQGGGFGLTYLID